MNRFRRVLKVSGAALLVLLLVPVLAFALAQTPPARAWLAAALGRAIADPGERGTIAGLHGLIPFNMKVERIEIDDARGARLLIKDASLAIAPGDLFAGRLTVRRMSARLVDIARPSATPLHLPISMMLHPPIPARLESLRIARLTLGAALVGEPVAATFSANGAFGGGRVSAEFDLHRVDATPGRANVHLMLSGTPATLDLGANIEERGGRLLADALGRTEPLPVSLHLTGKGPLSGWQGTLAFRAGNAATLDAQFRFRGDGGYELEASGKAQLASLVPPRLRPLFAGSLDFSAALALNAKTITLANLALSDRSLRLTASGSFARASGALAGKGTLALPDLAALAPLIGGAPGGSAKLALALGGTIEAPKARATLEGKALALGGNRIGDAAATVDLGAAGSPFAPATPIAISASGTLHGIALAAGPLPGGLADRLDWRLGAGLDRAGWRLELHELDLDDAGNSLSLQGASTDGAIAGEAMLRLPDIGRFAGAATSGALALAVVFHGNSDGSATAVFSGRLHAPRSGSDALDRLLGDDTDIAGTFRRDANGALALDDFSLKGANAALTAGAHRAADGRIDANYRLDLPRLAALGLQLAGRASVTGQASGPPDALSVSATLNANDLRAGTLRLDRLGAQLALPNLANRAGQLSAKFSGGHLRGSASAEGALIADTLKLNRIQFAATGTKLEGDLALDIKSRTVDGTLKGNASDLKPWSELLGTPLGGSAAFTARLSAAKGQSAALTLDGKAISVGGTHAARLHATAQLSGLPAAPTGRAALQIEQATLGQATVTSLQLDGTSTRPGQFALTLKAAGRAGEPYTLAGSATLGLARSAVTLRLARLSGVLGKAAVTLHQPLLLTRRGDGFAFADLDLGFGPGRISGSGSLKGTALALRLKGAALPVHDLAELGGHPDVSGVLGFEAALSGTRARPEGRLVVDGEELRLEASRQDLAPLGLVLSAEWQGGVITGKGRLAGPQNAALGFTGRAPLVLDPQRLALHLPPQGALALHLEGSGELANLADIVPLGEDRFGGTFNVDVSVDGTVAAPQASGRLSVRNGRYESLFWGTTVTGINLDLVGNRTRLVLQNFHGGDGAKGSLALSGAVELATPAGPTFDFTGKFKSFRAVQRDEATVTVSGDMSLAGTLTAPRLGAHLTIEQAELRVPKQLPQDAQPIPVTIINSATGQVLSRPEQSQQRAALLALALDVTVDMPGEVFVRGRGLDSEWRGQLRVTGTTAQPSISGKLEVVRGTYDFLGKSAKLTSGTITFLGGKRIDPDIKIEAQAASTDVIAIIDITGTATKPRIKLTSQPTLPQDEILSQLLFGTTVSKISAAQGLEIAQAAAALATGGDPGVIDRIRQGLGLDRLSLTSASATSPLSNVAMPTTPAGVPSAFPVAGVGSSLSPVSANTSTSLAGSSAVSAGKYVANGVYVGVTQGIDASSSAVNVQIDVTPHISIDTTAGGQNTGTGAGVNWKLDY
jgi:translocation and assembly module TamB